MGYVSVVMVLGEGGESRCQRCRLVDRADGQSSIHAMAARVLTVNCTGIAVAGRGRISILIALASKQFAARARRVSSQDRRPCTAGVSFVDVASLCTLLRRPQGPNPSP
jgi:hypothetical protein